MSFRGDFNASFRSVLTEDSDEEPVVTREIDSQREFFESSFVLPDFEDVSCPLFQEASASDTKGSSRIQPKVYTTKLADDDSSSIRRRSTHASPLPDLSSSDLFSLTPSDVVRQNGRSDHPGDNEMTGQPATPTSNTTCRQRFTDVSFHSG